MLKTQITGAKYLSPQTNQMTNLNIAVPADSKDTEFGTSDILLAKDTAALVADAKRTAFEGEKTTILAPTYLYRTVNDKEDLIFNKNININEGELHIKLHFDLINISKNNNYILMFINNNEISINDEKCIFFDFEGERYPIVDQQCEIVMYKPGCIEYISGNIHKFINSVYFEKQFKLSGFGSFENILHYTCEVFQLNFPTIKTSRLDNDDNYVKLDNDILNAKCIQFNRDAFISDTAPLDIIKVKLNDIKSQYHPRIISTGSSICFPYLTKICKKILQPESFSNDDYIIPIQILADYEKSVYKIVDTLPTTHISSRNIYMIKKTNPTDENIKYDKYIYIAEDQAWEKIG